MKRIGRYAIIAFCLWHMTAVASYVIPEENTQPQIKAVEEALLPYTRPYLFATSQWQKWNIFAPDPLRRVSSYFIEIEKNGRWEPLLDVLPTKIDWWKRSRELKILRRTEDNGSGAQHAYLAYLCRIRIAPAGAHLRLRRSYYVIPTVQELVDTGADWASYIPTYYDDILGDSYCP